jgi:hypothetical protein
MNRELLQQALDALEFPHDSEWSNKAKAIEALQHALTQPEQEPEAYGYAKRLAEFIWAKHYKNESPNWTPLPDVLGVLTQIDNMTCGLEKTKTEQEPVVWITFEWVGLTEDEIQDILDCGRGELIAIKKAEQRLKDKNTTHHLQHDK